MVRCQRGRNVTRRTEQITQHQVNKLRLTLLAGAAIALNVSDVYILHHFIMALKLDDRWPYSGFIARYIDKSHTPCQRSGIQETASSCRANSLVTVCGIRHSHVGVWQIGRLCGAGILDTEIRRRHCCPVSVNDKQATQQIYYKLQYIHTTQNCVPIHCVAEAQR